MATLKASMKATRLRTSLYHKAMIPMTSKPTMKATRMAKIKATRMATMKATVLVSTSGTSEDATLMRDCES